VFVCSCLEKNMCLYQGCRGFFRICRKRRVRVKKKKKQIKTNIRIIKTKTKKYTFNLKKNQNQTQYDKTVQYVILIFICDDKN
jgi:aspartate/tyrosine/aromatic aminotransferase